MRNPPKATIDFETRSACDIKRGAWLYSLHPTTFPLVLSYKVHDGPVRRWHPTIPGTGLEETPPPEDLFRWIEDGGLVEAHNRFFEFCIWSNVMVPFWGWPEVPELSWRCSAAKASYYGLPRALEGAVKSIDLPVEKDMEGNKVMLKVSKPRKPLKAERLQLRAKGIDPDKVVLWNEDRALHERNFVYCDNDVIAEHMFSEALPDLPETELAIWQMDQRMNLRGLRCDLQLARTALRLKDHQVDLMNEELREITGGEVETATSRTKFLDWAQRQGLQITDTQGATLDRLVKRRVRPDLHRALTIVREVNRTSAAKYETMLERADPRDERLRDLLMYHGANTGRWTGKGVQPHNFPRGDVKDIDTGCATIMSGSPAVIRALYGEVMKHLSDCLRGALTATPGRELVVADFSAIEARVVLWLARQESALQVFVDETEGRGHGIYCDMATGIYGRPITKKDKDERQFGKQAILGLGFEMGFSKFLITCKKYDIGFDEAMARRIVGPDFAALAEKVKRYFDGDKRRRHALEEAEIDYAASFHELVLMKYTVDVYRERYPEVVQMWRDQEAAALAAVRTPGRTVECSRGRNSWVVEEVGDAGPFLVTYLPSGKPLFYKDPKVLMKRTPFKNPDGSPKMAPSLTFMGSPDKGKGWVRKDTYGGKLVENITQATARDLMAMAKLRVDAHPDYDLLLSVHDEVIAEADPGVGSVHEFEQIMAHVPGWARGCPVGAEGWRGFRYRK